MASQGRLNHGTVMVVPGEYIQRFSYDANSQVEYEGYAPTGTAEGTNSWVIRKYTYNANLQQTATNIARDVNWTDRSSHTYS